MKPKQKKILKIAKELNKQYGNDFVGFVENYFTFAGLKLSGLTDQQKEIGYKIVTDKNLCVSAGGGIGKSAVAALLIIWFLATHPYSKVPTTAPSHKQLMDILWSEIDLWLKRCKIQDIFSLRRGKLSIKGFDEWYAVARTVPKDGKNLNDTLAGFHAPSLLICVDEASGVPDPVYTALEGAMTDSNSYVLLISNPVSVGGYYYDTISDPQGKGQDYTVLYYDSRDSPLVDSSFEERIINRYGKNHPMYKAKVLGLPISLLESVVITPEEFDRIASQNRSSFNGPVTLAIDVAAGGADKTIFCHKQGSAIVRWDEFITADPQDILDHAVSLYNRLWKGQFFNCVIDAAGIGWGPYHLLLNKAPFKTIGFIGADKSDKAHMFRNKRTEGYFILSKEFNNLHFPTSPPERLKKELVNLRFDYAAEPIEMEEKKKYKSRLGFSPDHADSLMMAVSVSQLGLAEMTGQMPRSASSAMQKLKITNRESRYGKYSKFLK
jgi:hypothetical protein